MNPIKFLNLHLKSLLALPYFCPLFHLLLTLFCYICALHIVQKSSREAECMDINLWQYPLSDIYFVEPKAQFFFQTITWLIGGSELPFPLIVAVAFGGYANRV